MSDTSSIVEYPISSHDHSDFLGPGDVTLVANDDTAFHISSSQLADASGWFRTLFSVPQGNAKEHTEKHRIVLPEDELTVEILLKICFGRPPGLSRLDSLDSLELCLLAAEKYEMPGATEVLLLVLHAPRMQLDALRSFALAGRYGEEDVAVSALRRLIRMRLDFEHISQSLDGPLMGRLIARRQERIETFCALFLATDGAAPFYREHSRYCTHPNEYGSQSHSRDSPDVWTSLALALQTAFVKQPAVEALESDAKVKAKIEALKFHTCGKSGCQQRQYEWRDIRTRLQDAMDGE